MVINIPIKCDQDLGVVSSIDDIKYKIGLFKLITESEGLSPGWYGIDNRTIYGPFESENFAKECWEKFIGKNRDEFFSIENPTSIQLAQVAAYLACPLEAPFEFPTWGYDLEKILDGNREAELIVISQLINEEIKRLKDSKYYE